MKTFFRSSSAITPETAFPYYKFLATRLLLWLNDKVRSSTYQGRGFINLLSSSFWFLP